MREGYVTSVPLLCGQRLAFPDLSLRLPSATALCGVASELDWEHLRRIELDTLADLILAEPWQGQVTWRVPLDTDDFGRVLDLLPALRSPGIELQVDLADPALVAKAVFATSLGIRVRVRLRPLGGEALVELNRLASSYLLGPAPRRAALEPFATLEREILAGGDGGLWVACEESPSDHLYLGENGLLALSRRFAEAGHAYGPLAELEGHGWERTLTFQKLEGYRKQLFHTRADCAFCEAYRPCQGWLRALDPGFDCAIWRLVLVSFEEALTMTRPPGLTAGPAPETRRSPRPRRSRAGGAAPRVAGAPRERAPRRLVRREGKGR